MNKDLDDRLIPNGEYRDAQNISVGKSEDDDIGSLENVMGNFNISNYTNLTGDVIGYLSDEPNNRIFLFITDIDETSLNVIAPSTAGCYIVSITPSQAQSGTANILVSGSFLNFSKSFPITGVNLVENLLFFTDNRNQPRKINVNKALGYYEDETDISVAKYNPYQTIELYKKTTAQTSINIAGTVLTLAAQNPAIKKGMKLTAVNNVGAQIVSPTEYLYVTAVATSAPWTITLNTAPALVIVPQDVLTFIDTTMTGENISPSFNDGNFNTWPGDPDYLEERYVRFSYRFQFDDGEYSIMAPFTQIAYIPKQKGYFLGSGGATATPTNEIQSYTSSLLEFMENGVQNVELIIPLPDVGGNCQPNIGASYKIQSVDILYKESNALAVKVLETIPYTEWSAASSPNRLLNYYTYQYQSRKPFRTLPEDQTVRVYDKVPVRALAQEISGNRVMYGNFRDKYNPPDSINYEVGFASKQTTNLYNNWAEYPNHSLKQNRNYQVGFVLADKFGRQSSVILSPIVAATRSNELGVQVGGSTVYVPYNTTATQGTIRDWFGDALQVTVETPISSNNGPDINLEYPGLYAQPTGGGDGFNIGGVTAVVDNSNPYTYTFTLNAAGGQDIPVENNYLRGEDVDYVKVTNITGTNPYVITCDGPINESFYNSILPAVTTEPKFAYTINEIGWYSYKVVVKQQEQDYYNVYTAGVLAGYPTLGTPLVPSNQTTEFQTTVGHISLIADNINKVPADLVSVGPEQKQFRSSEVLFGRVNNTMTLGTAGNVQYYPGGNGSQFKTVLHDTSTVIGTSVDLKMAYSDLDAAGQENLFQVSTNPNVSRISYGSSDNILGVVTTTMIPYLAIYETKPQESLLDIYWESSSQGLISDLNADVLIGFDGVTQISTYTVTLDESQSTAAAVTTVFQAQDQNGTDKLIATAGLTVDIIGSGGSVGGASSHFQLTNTNVGGISNLQIIRTNVGLDSFVYNSVGGLGLNKYRFNMVLDGGTPISFTKNLDNIAPNFGSQMTGSTGSKKLVDVLFGQSTTGVIIDSSTINVGTWAQNGDSTGIANVGLKFTMVNSDNTALSVDNYFSIHESTGAITKIQATTPLGIYNFKITVADAYDNAYSPDLGTGSLDSDSLNSAVPVTLQITIGETPVNSGAVTTCIDTTQNSSTAYGIKTITDQQAGDGNSYAACWYLSNQDLNNTASGTSLNDLPINWTNANQVSPAFRLGSTNVTATNPSGIKQQLNQGTIVFQCNLTQLFDNASPANPLTSSATVLVFHRNPAISSTWLETADINGFNPDTASSGSSPTLICSDNNNNAVASPTRTYAQVPFAFDQVGEYAILYTNISSTADALTNFPLAIVNATDLYYNTCVMIPDGQNISYVSDTSTKAYRYRMSSTSSSNYLFNVGVVTPTGSFYTNTHYPEYVKQFWGDEDLTQTLSPPSFNSSTPYYGWAVYSSKKLGTDVVFSNNTLGANYSSVWLDYYFSGKLTSIGDTEISTQPGTSYSYIQNYGSDSQSQLTVDPLVRDSGGSSI
jgi:hypothetical protein